MDNFVYVFDLTTAEIFPSLSTMTYVRGHEGVIVLRRRNEYAFDLSNPAPRRCVIILDGDSCGTVWADGTDATGWVPDENEWDKGNLLIGARGYNGVKPGWSIQAFNGGPFEGGKQRICYVSNCSIRPKMDPIRSFDNNKQSVPRFEHMQLKDASVTYLRPKGNSVEMIRFILEPTAAKPSSHRYEANSMFSQIRKEQDQFSVNLIL